MRLEKNGKMKYCFKAAERQFNNNLATVLQEIDLMRRETNGRMKYCFKAGERTIG